MMTGMVLLCLHLIVCVLVYLGIRHGVILVKPYLMPVVIFIPLWGLLCVLILHFQIGIRSGRTTPVGLEKLRTNEELYRGVFVDAMEDKDQVVPLEEALIFNDASLRRSMVMDVLNDNPAEYIDLLHQARMNEDVEVAHYASTAMAELSKNYDYKLQQLERIYSADPENEKALDDYCNFLGDYIRQGMVQGKMELVQRTQYSSLLRKKLEKHADFETGAALAENQLKLEDYKGAEETLRQMGDQWPNEQEYWMLRIRLEVQKKQGDRLSQLLREMEEKHIYLSAENRDRLAFWQEDMGRKAEED
ncbi:MAG: hypothetical protein Q4F28_12045 [Eubacteriales bacterium]|nr:hypothetical protein [Eubacteriales bacterium]